MTKFTHSLAMMTATQKTMIINQILRFISISEMLKCIKNTLWNHLNVKQFSRFEGYKINTEDRLHCFTSNRQSFQLVELELLSFCLTQDNVRWRTLQYKKNFPHFPVLLPLQMLFHPLPIPTYILAANYLVSPGVSHILFAMFWHHESFYGFWTSPVLVLKNGITSR